MGTVPAETYANYKADREKKKMTGGTGEYQSPMEDGHQERHQQNANQKKSSGPTLFDRIKGIGGGKKNQPLEEGHHEGYQQNNHQKKSSAPTMFDRIKGMAGGKKNQPLEEGNQERYQQNNHRNKSPGNKSPGLFNRIKAKRGGREGVTDANYAKEVSSHKITSVQVSETLRQLGPERIPNVSHSKIYQILQRHATYQGQFSNKIPHGKGIVHFRDGSYFAGNFVEGDAQGEGVYIFKNGSYYEGEFRQSRFSGEGSMTYLNKDMVYNGTWRNGVPQGRGTEKTRDGIYNGNFEYGRKHGTGEYRWQDGRKFEGQFRNGVMDGHGALYDHNGEISYKGYFRKGKKQGKGLLKTRTGTYYGNFYEDYLQGNGTLAFTDGKAYDGSFKRSRMDGQGVMYFPNGQIAQGDWKENHNYLVKRISHDQGKAEQSIQGIRRDHQKAEHEGRQSDVYQQNSYKSNNSDNYRQLNNSNDSQKLRREDSSKLRREREEEGSRVKGEEELEYRQNSNAQLTS